MHLITNSLLYPARLLWDICSAAVIIYNNFSPTNYTQPEIRFSDPSRDVAMTTNFVGFIHTREFW